MHLSLPRYCIAKCFTAATAAPECQFNSTWVEGLKSKTYEHHPINFLWCPSTPPPAVPLPSLASGSCSAPSSSPPTRALSSARGVPRALAWSLARSTSLQHSTPQWSPVTHPSPLLQPLWGRLQHEQVVSWHHLQKGWDCCWHTCLRPNFENPGGYAHR
jgi:hypothetical protein